ncbi:putative phosphoglycerate mutase (2,3-diphosphoglycerate-dependent) [Helianthus annuus]|uniref:phosphoglycerate mutase (2,3-diphosphoglycerate-dependent) n=1 Tax=Helianthus annuus TaxID=4232 RepID=A0A9K3NP84_HELAN|nr:2,3-bisphosphoglycerate-dependent phosphoglycerate mutase [Helianthus annuus]XP_022039748.1 2,3-bisphosphoglycerate-dependent phosphoglycerate mutase [Helianthus annuus]KAF5807724.1 putative phosphoglycerate mutase (2,3-diphosphoglycerate-dependent) [Helianthus annuus]KAJ0920872.1 putative phosphoglycerate mutase (2,3-diphosphoglycerate-dependent) [Helianthus annuus]KAJ0924464.1 putative phosphoglycerate mutase (2,3-diphosphoglycerate-dependent) [Helianthus annuus]
MAATTFNGSVATSKTHGYIGNFALHQDFGISSLQLTTKRFKIDLGLSGKKHHWSRKRDSCLIQASFSHATTVSDEVSTPVDSTKAGPTKKSREAALILIRHGESLWNEKNLFTGCVDVPLTRKGVEEAIEAGKRISNIPVDMIYTSALIRAQMTAMLAMTQHRRKKVPIVLHKESEQAESWSQIFSQETEKQCIPVVTAWQLNERMYGELQGLNKQETADKYGKEQVHEWRRSYDIPPPNGESLEMCAERAVAYFKEHIEPQLQAGKNVMIAAHGNSLRSIIMYLDKLTSQEVISLELSTGIPMLYIVKEEKYIRRGSPAAPSEPSVYAYTKNLARYRQKLDEMVH